MPVGPFARILVAFAGHYVLGRLLGRPQPAISAQRDPNEIVSSGEPTSPTQFVFGERRIAGFEIYRGVESYQVTTSPFSTSTPGIGRRLHLAFALCEGECEGPTGIRIGEDLIALSQGVKSTGTGLTAAPDTTSDGGIRWQVRVASGGVGTAIWYLRADGTQGASLRAAADRMGSNALPFGDEHRGTGIAWVHVALDQPPLNPQNADAKWKWPTSVPAFEFFLKGMKLRRADTGAVEWTQNAADVRWWIETQFLGFPADRIDATAAAAARALCARQVNLDHTQALGRVRFCYRLTATASAPSAPSGSAYPPGGSGWNVRLPTTTTALPYLWVAIQVYDTDDSEWGDWGQVTALSRPGGTTGQRPPGGRGGLGFISSITIGSDGDIDKTIDPEAARGVDVPGDQASATITVGPPEGTLTGTGARVAWAWPAGSRPVLPVDLAHGDSPVSISEFAVRPNTAGTVCNLSLTVSADLSTAWERADDAIVFVRVADGAEFPFDGPNRDSNRRRDATSPYEWRSRESWPDFRTWLSNSGDSEFWIRFQVTNPDTDDVTEIPPGIQPGEQDNPYIPLFNADRTFPIYGVNGVITGDDHSNPQSLRNELDIAWAGRAIYDGGKLWFSPGSDPTPAMALGPATGQTVAMRSSESARMRINALTASLAESRVHVFRPWTMGPLVDRAAEERDGMRIQRDIGIRGFVTSPAQAEALLAIQLRQSRQQRIVTRREEWSSTAIAIRPGERVTLLDPDHGFTPLSSASPIAHQGGSAGRYMRVLARRLDPGNLTILFDLVEHFDDTHVPDAFRFPTLEPDVTAPGAFAPAPSGLVLRSAADDGFDRSSSLRLEASWNPSSAARTLVQWRPIVPSGSRLRIVNADRTTTDLTATPDWGPPREQIVEGHGATITGVRNGVGYQVRIKHIGQTGLESAWSGIASITIGALDGISGPQNVTVTASAANGIAMTWTLPSAGPPALWRIQRLTEVIGSSDPFSGAVWGAPVYIDGNQTSWQSSSAETSALATIASAFGGGNARIWITMRIQAAIRHSQSDRIGGATEVRARLAITPTTPSLTAPTILESTAGNGSAFFRWGPVTGATRYDIQRAVGSGAWVDRTSTSRLGHTDTSVTNGNTYRYRVRAASSTETGPWSASVTLNPVATNRPPGMARNVRATATDDSITVTWEAPTSWGTGTRRSFTVFYTIPGTSLSFSAGTVASTVRTRTISFLRPSTAYNVRVDANTEHGAATGQAISITTEAAEATLEWGDWTYLGTNNSIQDGMPVGGDNDVSASVLEAAGRFFYWGPGLSAGTGQWTGRGRPSGLATTGMMLTKTVNIAGTNRVIQVFQSATSDANNMRRTDTNAVIGTQSAYLFSGDLDTRRSDDFDFLDAVLRPHQRTNSPEDMADDLPAGVTIRPIAALRWTRDSDRDDGAGSQLLVVPANDRLYTWRRLYSDGLELTG